MNNINKKIFFILTLSLSLIAPKNILAEESALFEVLSQSTASVAEGADSQSKTYVVKAVKANLAGTKKLRVPLPGAGDFILEATTSKLTTDGNQLFTGSLHSGVKIVGNLTLNINKQGELTGTANLLAPHYRAVFKGKSLKVVSNTRALGCGGNMKIQAKASGPGVKLPTHGQRAGISATSTVDILGVYTTDALTTIGSYSQVVSYLENQVAVANESHQTSGSGVTLRLIGIVALPSQAADVYDTDLEKLATSSDGTWDAIPRLKEWYGADMVTLVVGGTERGSICGLAYTPGSEEDLSAMANYMYSVISGDSESCQESIFAHEAGHNLGANHNRDDAGEGPVIYPYAYGYRFDYSYQSETVKALTVMSYAPNDGYYGWIRYFSTPYASYEGHAAGVVDEADNASVFQSTGLVVESFLTARSSLPKNATAISLRITKSGRAVTFTSTLKRSSRAVSNAQSALYWSSRSSAGSFRKLIRLDKSNSSGRWRYVKSSGARKGYYKLCQSVCSPAVRLK